MLPEIHISDVRTYRTCRRRWSWSSPLHRNLEPYIAYAPFFTGRAIHESLEYYHKSEKGLLEAFDEYITAEKAIMDEQGTMWPAEQVTLDEQIDLSRALLEHYLLWQAQDDGVYADKNFEYLQLEHEFVVPAWNPVTGEDAKEFVFAGKIDGLVRNKVMDEYWLWETKTTRSIDQLINSLVTDEQSALYLYAARKIFDVPIKGVMYNMLRKKAPTRPGRLANGLLSKAKNIDTTAFHYKKCVLDECPDWSDTTIDEFYGDILEKLRTNEYKYFLRYPIYKSDTEIRNTVWGIYWTALEMLDPAIPLYSSPGWMSCNFCPFKSPCLTMNAGSDYELLLREEYRSRSERSENESGTESDTLPVS